ncbi:agmatinase [Candidatus Bathyarchaeota archaeon]|nr:agmatinase [Candidatus Bathyarchaeota archaeon]
MSHSELFVSQSNVFSGFQKPLKEADYVVFGVPFDITSTYRTGARFGPNAIRQASLNIETYSFRTGVDVEDLRLHDLGDLHVSADVEKTLEKIELVTRDLLGCGKTPVIIGGEHTLTLGAMKGLGKKASNTAVVSFDAHLDVRNEFMDLKVSHTTFMRRIKEQVKPAKILEVGTRAVCKEELAYAKKTGIEFVPAQQIRREGSEKTAKVIKQKISAYDCIYVSVDMDFLDPAYVPAVQNPEADGLEPDHLLSILCNICDRRVVGFDVVEIAPNYDQGISAVQAAKVVFEILCCLEKSKKT